MDEFKDLERDLKTLKAMRVSKRRKPLTWERRSALAKVYAHGIRGKMAVLKMMCFAAEPDKVYDELDRRSRLW